MQNSLIELVMWVGFCITHGIYDGFMYHFRIRAITLISGNVTMNPHKTANIMRAFVCLGFSLPDCNLPLKTFLWIFLIESLSYMLMFSFFHNGFYFTTRNKYEPNLQFNFFTSFGKNSIAQFNFDFFQRSIMATVGLGTLFLSWYLF